MRTNKSINFSILTVCAVIVSVYLGGASALAGSFSVNVGHRGHYGHSAHRGHGRRFGHHRFGRSRGFYKPRFRGNRRFGYRSFGFNNFRPYYQPRRFYRRGGYYNFPYRSYPYRSYPYRAYPTYGATRFGRGYNSAYNIKVPVRSANTVVVVNNDNNRGWQLLAVGRGRDARFYFGDQARLNPTDGVPKLGYALASAVSGDFVRAEWAMRRAFQVDPESLHYVEFDESVKVGMGQLVERYKARMNANGSNAGDAFMLAALNFLSHDHRPATTYIDLAIGEGDTSTSAANLKQQLFAIADMN